MKAQTLKLFLFLCISIISACDTQPVKQDSDITVEEPVPTTERQLSLTEEAERLIELAEESDSLSEQQAYRAKAARFYLDAGNIPRARQQRDILLQESSEKEPAFSGKKSDTAEVTIETTTDTTILLLSAEIVIAEHNLTLANELIAKAKPDTGQQQIDYLSAKANLEYLSGNYLLAVEKRVQLDNKLNDQNDKNRNNQKIWAALSNIPTDQLNKQRSNNPTITGWIDLARVMRSGQHNISQLEDELLDWGTRHPAHPVSQVFLNELIEGYQLDATIRKRIAVILPMEGDRSKITDAIKNGLLSAYYKDVNSSLKPDITFYDSSSNTMSFYQLYQQAIEDGATNIIGPLDKVAINQLLQQREVDIPVLTLNYSENDFNYTDDLFQFGLSPADEARQVAELAIRQNKLRAAVFYPDSEWGRRLKSAFTEYYESLGGKVLSSADYATNTNDYRRPIRAMLNLDQSAIRHRKVDNIIGTQTKYEPYRRQDIDMIFLAATHRSARGIMPAFKFHHAGNITVYSTSHVYTGKTNRDLDRDLNGLIFCDMPWVLDNTSPLLKTFKRNWPRQENYTRLFALGIDAYHLIYNLDYLEDKDYAFYAGQTGNLQLTDTNRVTRKLLWAKFVKGKPVRIEPALPTSAALIPAIN